MDFVKEQHLTIDGAGTHFDQASDLLPLDICPLFVQNEVCIAPRTVRRLTVLPRNKQGLLCPAGTTGVVSSEVDDHGIWDAASKVQQDKTVDIIYANTARAEVKLSADRPIGYFQIIDPSEGAPLNDATIAEIFDNPAACLLYTSPSPRD